MHLSKDTMRSQLSSGSITTIVNNLATFGVTHIAISCPLDDEADYPAPQPTVGYVETWIAAIRAAGLKVFFRGAWNYFEGNYDAVPRRTPTSSPATPLGAAATVLSGADTTSYLYKTWNFIKTHGSYFAAGDIWGPNPEPENQGVGGATTDMFSSHAVLGQWLVDLKVISDDAFENTLGYAHEAVLTGMTSINGGTVEVNQVGASYWTQNGRVCIDHYIPVGNYSASLDTISTNSGGVDMYVGEWGTTGGSGNPGTDALRAADIQTVFTAFASKSYMKGVSYWQAVGGSPTASEALLDSSTYAVFPLSRAVILSFFTNSTPDNSFATRSGAQLMYKGSRFRFIGMNFYPAVIDAVSQTDIQALFEAAQKRGIRVFRIWCFDRGNPPTNSTGNFRYLSGGQLLWREATLAQLDMVLHEAKRHNIKLILSLADNPTYLTKKTYVDWANSIYSAGLSNAFPYIGFFSSSYCKQMYKDFIFGLANRVNTLNGRLYKNDDTIFSWELGNELRTDAAEGANINTINSDNLILLSKPNGWIDEMSTYIKSIDSNHLVSFSSCSHTWQWVDGDTVSNGTFYGVDYNIISALPNIDYLDFHLYPNQGGPEIQKFGQRLGYPNAVQGPGLRAQIRDYVTVGKANGKPVICGEIGFVKEEIGSNLHFPLYPRHEAFRALFDEFFGADGDGMLLWSATTTSGGSYSVVLEGYNDAYSNENTDDRILMWRINSLNTKLVSPTSRPRIV